MLDKIKGSLLGGAVGDALGFTVEFWEDFSIFEKYGERGITEYELYDGVAQISDDTQMSMFTAEGFLRARKNCFELTVENYVDEIYHSYLDWLVTQNHDYDSEVISERSELLNVSGLYSRRAPGHTCLSALESGYCGSFELQLNKSKGCGGVMRTAPIALGLASNEALPVQIIDLISARAAAITHTHPLGYIPSAFLGHVLTLVLRGEELKSAVESARKAMYELFGENEQVDFFDKLMSTAVELAEDDGIIDDLDAFCELGQGWVAEETVAIAVYCALKYNGDFESAIVAAVNHSGDSDSTGAVTGNIIGALVGYSKIPPKYTEPLEFKDILISLADALAK